MLKAETQGTACKGKRGGAVSESAPDSVFPSLTGDDEGCPEAAGRAGGWLSRAGRRHGACQQPAQCAGQRCGQGRSLESCVTGRRTAKCFTGQRGMVQDQERKEAT